MLVKGEVKEVLIMSNKLRVRIPVFESAGSSEQAIFTCTLCYSGIPLAEHRIGDIVYVEFENNNLNKGVVTGFLYTGPDEDMRKEETIIESDTGLFDNVHISGNLVVEGNISATQDPNYIGTYQAELVETSQYFTDNKFFKNKIRVYRDRIEISIHGEFRASNTNPGEVFRLPTEVKNILIAEFYPTGSSLPYPRFNFMAAAIKNSSQNTYLNFAMTNTGAVHTYGCITDIYNAYFLDIVLPR